MKRNLTSVAGTLALAACSFAATSTLAEAGWARSGGGMGPHGRTWNSTGSGACGGGSCSSHQEFVGPNGGVTTRNGSTSCAGGTCNHSATVTGPDGRSATRNTSWTHY
jgi:hypothetical protein